MDDTFHSDVLQSSVDLIHRRWRYILFVLFDVIAYPVLWCLFYSLRRWKHHWHGPRQVCSHLGVECFYNSTGQRAENSAQEAPEWLVTRVSVQPWTKDNNLLRKFKFSGTLPASYSDLQHLTWNLDCLWGCVSKSFRNLQLRLDKFVNLTSNYTD